MFADTVFVKSSAAEVFADTDFVKSSAAEVFADTDFAKSSAVEVFADTVFVANVWREYKKPRSTAFYSADLGGFAAFA